MNNTVSEVKFDSEKFRKDIIQKRLFNNRLSMREASKQIGISTATLSRTERGNKIDMDTFCKIIRWLVKQPNRYFMH